VVFFSSQIYTWDALRIPLKKRKWGERKENPPFFSKHPQHSRIKGHNRVEIYKGVSHKKNSGPLWKKTKEKGKRTLFLVTEKGGGEKTPTKTPPGVLATSKEGWFTPCWTKKHHRGSSRSELFVWR
jgi:hypothetical protein